MAKEDGKTGQGAGGSLRPGSPEEFAASLKRRGQAAQGLERDLLNEVRLLYGSPGGSEPHGDPGIVLAKIHQEQLLRRNGGGLFQSSGERSDVALPFERATAALALLLFLLVLFGNLDLRSDAGPVPLSCPMDLA